MTIALTLVDNHSFSLSDLAVSRTPKHRKALVRETNERLFIEGKPVSGLYDLAYTARVKVHNTGKVAGAEVPQVRLALVISRLSSSLTTTVTALPHLPLLNASQDARSLAARLRQGAR
jgi:hypothetical protein